MGFISAPENVRQIGSDVHQDVHCDLKKIPRVTELNESVRKICQESSWMDLYGWDWLILGVHMFVVFPISGLCLASQSWLLYIVGLVLNGSFSMAYSAKGGHLSLHDALCKDQTWRLFWCHFFGDFSGTFSAKLAHDIHIKGHHPHTNIVGKGDSSVWKAPVFPAYIYMFLAPMLFPVVGPFYATGNLLLRGYYNDFMGCICAQFLGVAANVWALTLFGLSAPHALLALIIGRGIMSVPYIHINIFQHIALPMWDDKDRPVRLAQMSLGVLNLHRNYPLEFVFGHSITSSHIEHHLFPFLSDHMCLKVKPVVRKFLISNGLEYHERSYFERISYFLKDYDRLMVNAPPIHHFIGIQ